MCLLAAACTGAHLFSPPSHAMGENILISHHPPSSCLSSAAWASPWSQGQLCHCSAGTAVSLLCSQPRLQPSTSHILLLVQVRAFPTRKSFGSHKQCFYFNLFAVSAVSYFKVTVCVPRREEGIAQESFFAGGVSNLPLRRMKMQILSKWH